MAISDGKIKAAVGFADVQSVLGTTAYDLGVLCRHENINMWAKFKPVRNSIMNIVGQIDPSASNTDKKWRRDDDYYFHDPATNINPWWQGADGKYGLNETNAQVNVSTGQLGMEDALNVLKAKINGGTNGWTYNKPRGGDYSEPFRLTDFNQYYHRAPYPVSGIIVNDVMASGTSTWYLTVHWREGIESSTVSAIADRDFITPQDVTNLTLHLGFAIFKDNNGTKIPIGWVIGNNTWIGVGIQSQDVSDGVIKRGDNAVRMKLSSMHTYYILPIYGTQQVAQPTATAANASGLPTSAMFLYTVPYSYFVPFKAVKVSYSNRYGEPYTSNHNIAITGGGYYSANLAIDRSTAPDYYNATGEKTIIVALVTEEWNGSWTTGTYTGYTEYTHNFTGSDYGQRVGLGTYTVSGLDVLTHLYRLVFVIDGEVCQINLIQKNPKSLSET